MIKRSIPNQPSRVDLDLFQPKPNTLYGLDMAARLAGVPRRSMLIYCRVGLLHPIYRPPYGIMEFTEESIHAARRIEYLRAVHGIGLPLLKTMFDLADEVDRLRAELTFLRNR